MRGSLREGGSLGQGYVHIAQGLIVCSAPVVAGHPELHLELCLTLWDPHLRQHKNTQARIDTRS